MRLEIPVLLQKGSDSRKLGWRYILLVRPVEGKDSALVHIAHSAGFGSTPQCPVVVVPGRTHPERSLALGGGRHKTLVADIAPDYNHSLELDTGNILVLLVGVPPHIHIGRNTPVGPGGKLAVPRPVGVGRNLLPDGHWNRVPLAPDPILGAQDWEGAPQKADKHPCLLLKLEGKKGGLLVGILTYVAEM